MIISASRRTDIAAFYAPWMLERLRQGWCEVPNPFNHRQVSRISLRPDDVEAIAFWTRNPRPLMPSLDTVEALGHRRYYFLFTVIGNPRTLDPKSPPVEAAIGTFRDLAQRIGPGRVVWRYDPIVFTPSTGADFHRANFDRLAARLEGHTRRVVVSLVDPYKKALRRLAALRGTEAEVVDPDPAVVGPLLADLRASAAARGMVMESCAEALDMRPWGIMPGRCIDDRLLRAELGLDPASPKDPGQRAACGCVVSRDIGMYDSCLFGCVYCYATRSFELARERHAAHDAASPTLLRALEPDVGVTGRGEGDERSGRGPKAP